MLFVSFTAGKDEFLVYSWGQLKELLFHLSNIKEIYSTLDG